MGIERGMWAVRHMDRKHNDRHTDRQVERETHGQTDKQADKGKDRLEYFDSFQVINKISKKK
jgi:hypothetical protein